MIVQKSNKVLVNIWKLRRVLKKEKTKIRRGNQKMRANQKVYGGLLINVATSMNEMIVEAHKGGKVAC